MAYTCANQVPSRRVIVLLLFLLALCLPAVGRSRSHHSKKTKAQPQPEFVAREAKPTSTGDRSLTRALDLKISRIVIDPGHGGWDNGTVGAGGLLEKDLVLDVSQRLGRILQRRMGADVIYTRDSDTFIPLETRTAIANHENADLFISIHGNHSDDPETRGIETYYLSFTAATDALEVAGRENAASQVSVGHLQDLVKEIALNEKVGESREFAANVERSLYAGIGRPGIRDRGVKKAPFIVLIGAHMPSILTEISFLSNSTDEANLKKPEYREEIAESIYRGIAKYVSGLSGVRPATAVASIAPVGVHLPPLPPPPVPAELRSSAASTASPVAMNASSGTPAPQPSAAPAHSTLLPPPVSASLAAPASTPPAAPAPAPSSSLNPVASHVAPPAATPIATASAPTPAAAPVVTASAPEKPAAASLVKPAVPAVPHHWGAMFVAFVAHQRILIVMILLLAAAWSVAHDYNEPARRFARRYLAAVHGDD